MRTWNALKIGVVIGHLLKSDDLVDPIEWLANPVNIALENSVGDLAIFEYAFPTQKIYSGHYYFQSRGKQAIQSGRDFLDELFNTCYTINVLTGMVPVEHLGAKWITRRLGFTSHGIEEVHGKEYELFILTKKEFNCG